MTFDLSKLDVVSASEDGLDVYIINPKTNEKTGIVIKVQGAFSAKFQEMMARQRKKDAIRAKNAVARAIEEEDETPAVLSEVTINWGLEDEKGAISWGDIKENGEHVKFSKSEAVRVYEKYPVIRTQVLSQAVEIANFIKG